MHASFASWYSFSWIQGSYYNSKRGRMLDPFLFNLYKSLGAGISRSSFRRKRGYIVPASWHSFKNEQYLRYYIILCREETSPLSNLLKRTRPFLSFSQHSSDNRSMLALQSSVHRLQRGFWSLLLARMLADERHWGRFGSQKSMLACLANREWENSEKRFDTSKFMCYISCHISPPYIIRIGCKLDCAVLITALERPEHISFIAFYFFQKPYLRWRRKILTRVLDSSVSFCDFSTYIIA